MILSSSSETVCLLITLQWRHPISPEEYTLRTAQHLSTLQWVHIHLNGSYHFTDITLNADFRPLREYQGPRLLRAAQSSMPEGVDAETISATEEEELLDPIQLSLFLEEEEGEL